MEQRSEQRIGANVRFFATVFKAEQEPDMEGLTLECQAVDLSAHGMQLALEAALSPGALLNLSIGVGEPFAMYVLRAEVRWVKESDESIFLGVMLKKTEDTDFDTWLANFDRHFMPTMDD